jgi:hypothetical protein
MGECKASMAAFLAEKKPPPKKKKSKTEVE